jgi:HlyD family secretion protein
MIRYGLAALALLLVAVIALALRDPPLPVEAASVSRGPLVVYVEEEVRSRVRVRHVVASPLPGEISRVELRPGDMVTRGQTVAAFNAGPAPRLDASQVQRLRAELTAAQADLRAAREQATAARASASQADRELTRADALAKADVVPAEALERARTQAELTAANQASAEAAVDAALGRVGALQALLAPCSIGAQQLDLVSPANGVVLRRLRQSAGPVAAGEVLLEIGDPTNIEIVGELLSEDALQLQPGAQVELTGWGGEELLQATVERVEPAAFTKVSALGVEEQRVLVLALPADSGPDWPQLGDGYRLRARYRLWSSDDVLKVPSAALQRDRDGWSVLRIEAGRAQRVNVQIGQRNDAEAEVLGGLAVSDQVVLYGDDRVVDGARVSLESRY